jgi:hypothetical protein
MVKKISNFDDSCRQLQAIFFCLFIAQFLIKYGHNMVQITSPYYVKVMERGWERQWGKIQR